MGKKSLMQNLYLLVGPSGAGKTELQKELVANGFTPVRSYTTREPRFEGETSYRFINDQEFLDKAKYMLGATAYQNHFYGATPAVIDEGDIYIVEPKGVQAIVKGYRHRTVIVIGITCPMSVLEQRLRARGDSEDSIKSRLEGDCTLFGMMPDFCDVIFRNDRTIAELADSVMNYILVREKQTEEAKKAGEKKAFRLPGLSMDHIIHNKETCAFAELIIGPTARGPIAIPAESEYTGIHVGKHVWETQNDMYSLTAPYKPGDKLYCQEIWRPYSAWEGSSRGCEIEYEDGELKKIVGTVLAIPDKEQSWKPATAMPEGASRCYLTVKTVKPMRVQDVTVETILKMGIQAEIPGVCTSNSVPKGFETWSEERRNEWIKSTARAKYIGNLEYADNLLNKFRQEWNAQYNVGVWWMYRCTGPATTTLWYPYDSADVAKDRIGQSVANPWVWVVEFERE